MPTRSSFVLVVWVVLGACRPEAPERCLVPYEGVWAFHSAAFGPREYSAQLLSSQRDCVFELSAWQPDSGEAELHGGSISLDETVVFEGSSYWATCTGAISEGGAVISGDCEDGTTFHFMHVPPDGEGGSHNH